MEKTTIGTAAVTDLDGCERWSISDALGATAVSFHEYRIMPGEGLPAGLHAHMDQEELFIVLEGEATFETMEGQITVSEREAIRFEPGDFQSGKNETDQDVVLLAVGAPPGTEDIRIPVDCPGCEHESLRLDPHGPELTFVCPDCDTTHRPADCPNCGGADLQTTLDDKEQIVVICQECNHEFDRPPLLD